MPQRRADESLTAAGGTAVKIAINRNTVNKATTKEDHRRVTFTYQNVDLIADQLAGEIDKGHAFCAQHKDKHRKSAHFTCAGFLAVDIDHGMTWDEALASPFVAQYATLLYTTPSHTAEANRFRILFELESDITDAQQLWSPSCSSSARRRTRTGVRAAPPSGVRGRGQPFAPRGDRPFHDRGAHLPLVTPAARRAICRRARRPKRNGGTRPPSDCRDRSRSGRTQFSFAPASIQALTRSISFWGGFSPWSCGIRSDGCARPSTSMTSALVKLSPGLTTAPYCVPFMRSL